MKMVKRLLKGARESFKKRVVFPVRNRLHPRRFQGFCVGSLKSGTHSIAGLFEQNYQSVHEPESKRLIDTLVGVQEGRIQELDLTRFLIERDKRLWLEMESSHLLSSLVPLLVKLFKDAKFILTIRDCYSWLESCINHKLNRNLTQKELFWVSLRDMYFRPDKFPHPEEERILADQGMYALDGYLSFWEAHNRTVLNMVPKERLLIIRTHEIGNDLKKISDFFNIAPESLEIEKRHMFKAKKKHNLLAGINRDHLEEKVNQHCRELMDRFFPEIKSFDDI